MILQEKATKELLEYNLRREGPIFEGDESYIGKVVKVYVESSNQNTLFGKIENNMKAA